MPHLGQGLPRDAAAALPRWGGLTYLCRDLSARHEACSRISWSRASVVVGAGLFVLALLLTSWLSFSNDEEFERFSPAVRILAALVVSLVGLIGEAP